MTFAFELPVPAAVPLLVHDIAGRAVRRLVKSELGPGEHSYLWDGLDDRGERLLTGVYYASLHVAGTPAVEPLTRKLVLVQ